LRCEQEKCSDISKGASPPAPAPVPAAEQEVDNTETLRYSEFGGWLI